MSVPAPRSLSIAGETHHGYLASWKLRALAVALRCQAPVSSVCPCAGVCRGPQGARSWVCPMWRGRHQHSQMHACAKRPRPRVHPHRVAIGSPLLRSCAGGKRTWGSWLGRCCYTVVARLGASPRPAKSSRARTLEGKTLQPERNTSAAVYHLFHSIGPLTFRWLSRDSKAAPALYRVCEIGDSGSPAPGVCVPVYARSPFQVTYAKCFALLRNDEV